MKQMTQRADQPETYDDLARAVDRLRYAFDGIDPDNAVPSDLDMALEHVQKALNILTKTG